MGSADIKAQLAKETRLFGDIDRSFTDLMVHTATQPLLDIAARRDLAPKLEGLAAQLERVQKSLGEYLERQRNRFPRYVLRHFVAFGPRHCPHTGCCCGPSGSFFSEMKICWRC